MRLLSIILLAAAVTGCAVSPPAEPAPTLEGHWRGQFERGGATLDVELVFEQEGDAITGVFSAPRLRAVGVPLRNVREDGSAVHFELAGDETVSVFDGAVTVGTLRGAYAEGEARGAFSFERVATPPPSCIETPAQFSNGAVTLTGTLLSPERPRAAVLFMHGSGPQGRHGSGFEALALCRAGFAALIYDKRGVGESGGDWRNSDYSALADDAVAGLDWLAARPELAGVPIGLYGHSQGGSIAPLAASRWPRIAFVIAGAGSGVSTADTERFSLRNVIAPLARDDADRREAFAYVDRVVDAGVGGVGVPALLADEPRYAAQPWYFPLPPQDNHYWNFQRMNAGYDPTQYWRSVRAPVLLIYGEHDERVPGEASIAAIRAALPAQTRVDVVMLTGAEHAYRIMPADGTYGWPQLAPEFPQVMIDFIASVAAD